MFFRAAGCEVVDIMRGIVLECNIGYDILTEEDRNFTAGWVLDGPDTPLVKKGAIDAAFKYHR